MTAATRITIFIAALVVATYVYYAEVRINRLSAALDASAHTVIGSRGDAVVAEPLAAILAEPRLPANAGLIGTATNSLPQDAVKSVPIESAEPERGPLTIGPPPYPEPRGGTFWHQFYQKHGELSQSEYSKLARSQRLRIHEMSADHATEMLKGGRYYPRTDLTDDSSDGELRRLLSGDSPRLNLGGASAEYGAYYVVFDPAEHFDVYDAYWEWRWLTSAASGSPLHRSD